MIGQTDRGGDCRVGLRRPDEPVRELGMEAGDQRVEHGCIRVRQDACGLTLLPMVPADQVGRELVVIHRSEWCGRRVPELGGRQLLRRARVGDGADLRQVGQVIRGAEGRRRRRHQLIRRGHEKRPGAVE